MSTSRRRTASRDRLVDIVIANGIRAINLQVDMQAQNIKPPRSVGDLDLHRPAVNVPLSTPHRRHILIGNNTVELPPTASIMVSL